jgi:hypothetical protein
MISSREAGAGDWASETVGAMTLQCTRRSNSFMPQLLRLVHTNSTRHVKGRAVMWWTARRIDIFGPLPPPNTSNTHVFWAVGVNVQAIAAAYPSDPDALGLAAEARMNISPWWVCGPDSALQRAALL